MILAIVIMVVFISMMFIKNLFKTGYYNNTPNGYVCGHGYFLQVSIFGNKCKPCTKGYYCPGNDNRTKCPSSSILTTAGEGKTSSKDCNVCKEKGKMYSNGKCVPCAKGYYCDGTGKYQCPKGKTTKSAGSKKASECITINCKKSEYIKNGACTKCPKDSYCNGVDAISCGKNKITKSDGQSSSSACICKSGYYLPSGGSICIVCEKGKSCNNNKMTACALGTYQDQTGQSSCKNCPNNKSATKTGAKSSSECTVCKAGTYLSNGKCVSCPSGFTSPIDSKSISKCTMTVSAGKYISKCSKTSCTISSCTGNTYSTSKTVSYSTTLTTKCSQCESGKVANSTHTGCVTSTVECSAGQYKINNQCKTCPKCNGVTCFNAPVGATSVTQCFGTVPAGKQISCTSSSCTVTSCTGNTYSTSKRVNYSSSLKTTCTSCGTKKANSTHTGCV